MLAIAVQFVKSFKGVRIATEEIVLWVRLRDCHHEALCVVCMYIICLVDGCTLTYVWPNTIQQYISSEHYN